MGLSSKKRFSFAFLYILISGFILSSAITNSYAKNHKESNHEILVRIIGDKSIVSTELRQTLLSDTKGRKIFEDLDGDKDPDIVTYIDNASKHSNSRKPILVRVIDDDDDMTKQSGPDKDDDCYVVDWNADGKIDRVVDYWDEDHDGDADRMDLYSCKGLWFGENIGLTIVIDVGDDDRMWATRDYEYDQGATQWLTDFNGDESFCMHYYDREHKIFVPTFENPFTHHDIDDDGLAEYTIRFSGHAQFEFQQARYSFDVDNDSTWLNKRDYDFSFNLKGPTTTKVYDWRYRLRDNSLTQQSIPWHQAREAVERADWKSNVLAWDEIDNNVNVFHEYERLHERWEGVGGYGGSISYGNLEESNKRWEQDADYSGKMQLYYNSADHRIHLMGAECGAMNFDYDYDGKIDAKISYADTDSDSFFDAFSYDADADGKSERNWKAEAQVLLIPCRYPELTNIYQKRLDDVIEQNQKLIAVMKKVLREEGFSKAEKWFITQRPTQFYDPEKLLWSREATRLYQDMIREEFFTQLLDAIEKGKIKLNRNRLENAYFNGRFAEAAKYICDELALDEPSLEPWLKVSGINFTKRILVKLTNIIGQDQPSAPIVIPIASIRKIAPDFNPACFTVAETQCRIVIRQYPCQADDLDSDGILDEIVFCLRDMSRHETRECFIYYAPAGTWSGNYIKQTYARDGIGISVGWESEYIGFRSYNGKYDFFGKKIDCLRLDNLGNYHKEAEWGMDALHVGSSPGLGGLSLWVDNKVVRVYNEENQPPRCQLTAKVVSNGPVRSAIRWDINDIKVERHSYSMSIISSVYANQPYSENRIHLLPATKEQVALPILSVGLPYISKASLICANGAKILNTWGLQDSSIGNIGLAIIAESNEALECRSLPDSEELLLKLSNDGKIITWTTAEWEKSRPDQRRLIAKTPSEWKKQLKRLAERLLAPPICEIISVTEQTWPMTSSK